MILVHFVEVRILTGLPFFFLIPLLIAQEFCIISQTAGPKTSFLHAVCGYYYFTMFGYVVRILFAEVAFASLVSNPYSSAIFAFSQGSAPDIG